MGKTSYDFIRDAIKDMFERYDFDFARNLARAGLKQELLEKKISPSEYVKLRAFITTEYIRKVVDV